MQDNIVQNSQYEFQKRFDIVPLPSGGLFYENRCDKVKLYDLTNSDDTILTAPNLLASGEMVDVLLRKKVHQADGYDKFISPDQMVIGDRLALIILLRAKMDNIYNVPVPELEAGFYPFDLNTLPMKQIEDMEFLPDEKGCYEYQLPISKHIVRFRAMTAVDEREIRREQHKNGGQFNEYNAMKLVRVVESVDGNKEKMYISNFLKNIPLKDGRYLNKFMNDVIPTFDLSIKVPSPTGGFISTFLRLDTEFWYPSI